MENHLKNLEKVAIKRLKAFEPEDGYFWRISAIQKVIDGRIKENG